MTKPLSVEHYHKMIDAGILTGDDRVELLEGSVVRKAPNTPPHSMATGLTYEALERIIPAGWHVDGPGPVTTHTSEPEPDVSVVRGDRRKYSKGHAGPSDLGLLIEVSDSALERDRGFKKRIYAAANVPIYWIVNLVDSQIEVYTDPTGPAAEPDYRQRRDYKGADEVPVMLEGKEIGRLAVRELLP